MLRLWADSFGILWAASTDHSGGGTPRGHKRVRPVQAPPGDGVPWTEACCQLQAERGQKTDVIGWKASTAQR